MALVAGPSQCDEEQTEARDQPLIADILIHLGEQNRSRSRFSTRKTIQWPSGAQSCFTESYLTWC